MSIFVAQRSRECLADAKVEGQRKKLRSWKELSNLSLANQFCCVFAFVFSSFSYSWHLALICFVVLCFVFLNCTNSVALLFLFRM